MHLSSNLCRTQQRYQRDRADNANLRNARRIADAASVAWEREALVAEGREERQKLARKVVKSMPSHAPKPQQLLDWLCSENPDREFAND
jgi:hypothetical protein